MATINYEWGLDFHGSSHCELRSSHGTLDYAIVINHDILICFDLNKFYWIIQKDQKQVLATN